MKPAAVPESRQNADSDFTSAVQPAIRQLARAFLYAENVRCDPWQFAVEIGKLLVQGISTSDLRWLTMKGCVRHARETTHCGDSSRTFLPGQNLAFVKKTCFVLTQSGFALLESDGGRPSAAADVPKAQSDPSIQREVIQTCRVPHFDVANRTLYIFQQVVKEYRVPSPNQEAILVAFQEEGWPPLISDPLSPVPNTPPKARLRETIRCLNASQRNSLIRFHGDGTGEGVRWKLSENARLLLPYLTPTSPHAA